MDAGASGYDSAAHDSFMACLSNVLGINVRTLRALMLISSPVSGFLPRWWLLSFTAMKEPNPDTFRHIVGLLEEMTDKKSKSR
jgi:hypothetical protein